MSFTDKLIITSNGIENLKSKNANTFGSPMIDSKKQFVPRTNISSKREPKKHCCYFCHAIIKDQMKRHIINVHSNEEYIMKAKKKWEMILSIKLLEI